MRKGASSVQAQRVRVWRELEVLHVRDVVLSLPMGELGSFEPVSSLRSCGRVGRNLDVLDFDSGRGSK